MRLALENKKTGEDGLETKGYTIYINSTPGNFTTVNGSMTLEQVNDKYWKVNKPLEMYYSTEKEDN